MSTREIIYAAAGTGESYWFARLTDPSSTLDAKSVVVDDVFNVYAYGECSVSGVQNGQIVKYNTEGVLQEQEELYDATDVIFFRSCTIDTSNNIYSIVRYDPGSGGSDLRLAIQKYDSSLSVTWQKTLDHATSNINTVAITNDGSGNSYVHGEFNTQPSVYKYNSSGVLQWNRTVSVSNVSSASIALDSSSNSYIGASQPSIDGLLVIKINSSGVLQWIKKLTNTNSYDMYAIGMATDSNGDIYAVGEVQSPDSVGIIVKYDSSGAVLWQRTLANSGEDLTFSSVACDINNDVYVVGLNYTQFNVLIVKYDSSGTILWQRTLSYDAGIEARDIKVKDTNFYICGVSYSSSVSGMLVAKLPTNGGLTGTYGSYVYASSSYTDASSSYTEGTISNSSTTDSYTEATSTFTASTTTYTSTTTSI
jgi:hypothetical protein